MNACKFIFILLTFSHIVFSQNAETLKISRFTKSECCKISQKKGDISYQPRIIKQSLKNTLLKIRVLGYGNCCTDFQTSAKFQGDTLFLSYEEVYFNYDSTYNAQTLLLPPPPPCECDCPFEFTYHITNVKHKNFIVKLNKMVISYTKEKYYIYPIEYKIYKGKKINKNDKYGRLQGKQYYFNTDEGYLSVIMDKKNGITETYKSFYKNGNLRRKTRYNLKNSGKNITWEYDENGKLLRKGNLY